MKRSPLKRKTPLKRTGWKRRVLEAVGEARPRRKSKYKRRPRAIAYMRWVKTQPCAALGITTSCDGPIEAHHAGEHGLGQKALDRTCIPLCRRHHAALHDGGLPFGSIGGRCAIKNVRAWSDIMIEQTQETADWTGVEVPSC